MKEERELLDKGLQYNIQQTSKTNWTNLVVETEQAIRLVETRSQEAYRILAAKNSNNYSIRLTMTTPRTKDTYT